MQVVLKGGVEWYMWYVCAYVFLCVLEKRMVRGMDLRGARVTLTFQGPVRKLMQQSWQIEVAMQWDLGVFRRVGLTSLGDGVDLGKMEGRGEACLRCLPDLWLE